MAHQVDRDINATKNLSDQAELNASSALAGIGVTMDTKTIRNGGMVPDSDDGSCSIGTSAIVESTTESSLTYSSTKDPSKPPWFGPPTFLLGASRSHPSPCCRQFQVVANDG